MYIFCSAPHWPWWRHQMETFSALLALSTGNSPVTCEFPTQRPPTWRFDLHLNKRLSKQWWGWWLETPWGLSWRHCSAPGRYGSDFFLGSSQVTGEFPSQRPVTRSFDIFFHLCLNERLSKQSWGWWSETPSRSLWCHCYGNGEIILHIWADDITTHNLTRRPSGVRC